MEKSSILLVDDNPDDILLSIRALKANNHLATVAVHNGYEALKYLHVHCTSNSEMKLALLDLNMPGMSGIELLKRIRECENTKFLPTVIFSRSADRHDLCRAYEAGANGYIQKPDSFEQYTSLLHMVVGYWIHWNESLTRNS